MDRFDMIQDDNGNVLISNSDLVYGISDEQHIQDTIYAFPGWWKENFADGVGLRSYLSSAGQTQILARSIKVQLQSDLYTVNNPIVKFDASGKLTINPNATL